MTSRAARLISGVISWSSGTLGLVEQGAHHKAAHARSERPPRTGSCARSAATRFVDAVERLAAGHALQPAVPQSRTRSRHSRLSTGAGGPVSVPRARKPTVVPVGPE